MYYILLVYEVYEILDIVRFLIEFIQGAGDEIPRLCICMQLCSIRKENRSSGRCRTRERKHSFFHVTI